MSRDVTRRRWWQFSLASMLWIVLVFAAFFGGMYWDGYRRDREIRENELAAEQQHLDAQISQLKTMQHIQELRTELKAARRRLETSELTVHGAGAHFAGESGGQAHFSAAASLGKRRIPAEK